MNHAHKAISKAGLDDLPRSTIITPNEPDSPLFDENHDQETIVAMNLQDTINNITPEIRKSLHE